MPFLKLQYLTVSFGSTHSEDTFHIFLLSLCHIPTKTVSLPVQLPHGIFLNYGEDYRRKAAGKYTGNGAQNREREKADD
jgi:hypothetical protein